MPAITPQPTAVTVITLPLPTALPAPRPTATAGGATPGPSTAAGVPGREPSPAAPTAAAPYYQTITLGQGQYYYLWWGLKRGQRVTHTVEVSGVARTLGVYVTGPDGTRLMDLGQVDGSTTVAYTTATPGEYTLWLDDRSRKAPDGLKTVRVGTTVGAALAEDPK